MIFVVFKILYITSSLRLWLMNPKKKVARGKKVHYKGGGRCHVSPGPREVHAAGLAHLRVAEGPPVRLEWPRAAGGERGATGAHRLQVVEDAVVPHLAPATGLGE